MCYDKIAFNIQNKSAILGETIETIRMAYAIHERKKIIYFIYLYIMISYKSHIRTSTVKFKTTIFVIHSCQLGEAIPKPTY
jgi:hypothetical protein